MLDLYKSPPSSLFAHLRSSYAYLALVYTLSPAMTDLQPRDDRDRKNRTNCIKPLHMSKKSCIFAAEIGKVYSYEVESKKCK